MLVFMWNNGKVFNNYVGVDLSESFLMEKYGCSCVCVDWVGVGVVLCGWMGDVLYDYGDGGVLW